MTKGVTCRNPAHKPAWRVSVRNANYSTFNGGFRTPSAYSEVICTVLECPAVWRTKAAYVNDLPDHNGEPACPA